MYVYFVRHGTTQLNIEQKHQSAATPLSERGCEEAHTRAEALRVFNPDLLLTSSYTRALETARIIGYSVGLTPKVEGFFHEVERPASLYGKSHYALESYWYALLTLFHRNNPHWRYKGGENFTDISNRAKQSLAYIEKQRGKYESIVVVSHAAFINIMVSYMCENKMLGFWNILSTFFRIRRLKNTGYIALEYVGNGEENTCNWRIVCM